MSARNPRHPGDSASHGLAVVGGLLAALIGAFVLIAVIGERYGTRHPIPPAPARVVTCSWRLGCR